MNIELDSVTPIFGENYNVGYIGFTYHKQSVVSIGIAYFTRWSRMSDIKVSHVFVVSGENECIEAVGEGVRRATLSHYFEQPGCQVFFRKPKPYGAEVGARLRQAASEQVGKAYDTSLIAAQAIQGSFLGHWIDKIFGGAPERMVAKLLNSDDEWICSELAAYCLDKQPEYCDQGILLDPNETIDPQELFEDDEIFTAWKKDTDE